MKISEYFSKMSPKYRILGVDDAKNEEDKSIRRKNEKKKKSIEIIDKIV